MSKTLEKTQLDIAKIITQTMRRRFAAQVKHLYSQGIAGIRGSFVAAIIMTIFLWNYVSHSCLMIWFVCYAIACGIGEVLFRAIQKNPSVEQTANDWARRFSALSIVGGILWGSTPILLFPTESISHQALLTFVLGGMSVGITISHGAMRAAHLPFILRGVHSAYRQVFLRWRGKSADNGCIVVRFHDLSYWRSESHAENNYRIVESEISEGKTD